MYYVYILKNELDGKLYIGYTNNLVKRVAEHNNKKSFYTKRSNAWVVAYFEGYASKADAIDRERKLKSFGRVYSQLKRRIERSLSNEKVRG